jgi:hypothetical protein
MKLKTFALLATTALAAAFTGAGVVESTSRRCGLVGDADLNDGVIWRALDRAAAEDLDAAGSDRLRHGLATECEAAGEGYKKISHER